MHDRVRRRRGSLVAAARDGDRAAFDELVDGPTRRTYTLALRLTGERGGRPRRDPGGVPAGLSRASRATAATRSSRTWLYRITANCASTFLGSRTRHRHDELGEVPSRSTPSRGRRRVLARTRPSCATGSTWRSPSCPPSLRAVVVLRDVYDLPHEAIAAELGISVSAAKVRLHRARHRLRVRLFPEIDEVDVRAV